MSEGPFHHYFSTLLFVMFDLFLLLSKIAQSLNKAALVFSMLKGVKFGFWQIPSLYFVFDFPFDFFVKTVE